MSSENDGQNDPVIDSTDEPSTSGSDTDGPGSPINSSGEPTLPPEMGDVPEDPPDDMSGQEGSVFFHDLAYSGASVIHYDREGNVAFDGEVFDTVGFSITEEGLWAGSISNGTALIFAQGSPIPSLSGATRFNGISDLALASDGSVAVNLGTIGAQEVSVLGTVQDNELFTYVYTGQRLSDEPDAPQVFRLNAFSRSPSLTAARVDLLPQGAATITKTLLVFPDDSLGTTVDFATDVPQSIAGAQGCVLDLANDSLAVGGSSVNALDDGSVVFDSALAGEECAYPEGIIRFADGGFDLIIGAGEVVSSNPSFNYLDVKLIDALDDGTLIVSASISSGPAPGQSRIATLSIDTAGERQLLFTLEQTFSTPTENYGSARLPANFSPSFNVNGVGAMIVPLSLPPVEETAVFASPARPLLPSGETFSESENRSLEYRLGTLDPVPEPYGGDHFFTNLSTVHALSDGSIVLIANVRHPDVGGNVSQGIWIIDAGEERRVRELYRFGEALLGEDGVTRAFDGVVSRLNETFISDESGGLYFVGTASGGFQNTLVRINTRP